MPTMQRAVCSAAPILVALLGQSAAAQCAFDQLFHGPMYQTGDDPYDLASADMNNDGRVDIVLAINDEDVIRIFWNDGDGTLSGPTVVETGARPWGPTPIDVDLDGIVDLVVANRLDDDISVFRGLGRGMFEEVAHFGGFDRPTAFAATDFEPDGDLDLIVASRGSDSVQTLRNDDGVFVHLNTYPAIDAVTTLKLADVTDDGAPDLVMRGSSSLAVMPGLGGDAFGPPVELPAGNAPRGVDVADLNGDSHLDIVVGYQEEDALWIYFGAGGGAFADPVELAAGEGPNGVLAIDLNADGHLDLVSAQILGPAGVIVMLGDGAGGFEAPTGYESEFGAINLVGGDFDGDEHVDIIVIHGLFGAGSLRVMRGAGAGELVTHPVLTATTQPWCALPVDLNQDGLVDLVTGNNLGVGNFAVYRNTGDGVLTLAFVVDEYAGMQRIASGDFNGDGETDLATISSSKCYVFYGQGDMVLSEPEIYQLQRTTGWLSTGDLNHDGLDDIHVLLATDPAHGHTLLAQPGGGFDVGPFIQTSDGAGTQCGLADVDLDGELDLVQSHVLDQSITIGWGVGDGTFTPPSTFTAGVYPHGFTVADVNADGLPDVLVANTYSETVSIHLGAGDRQLEDAVHLEAGQEPWAVAVMDADGDGCEDIVLVERDEQGIRIFQGQCDGAFSDRVMRYVTGRRPWDVGVADFNLDGAPDLVVANSHFMDDNPEGDVSVMLNQCPTICAADLDGDGVVTPRDLARLLAGWGACQTACPADLNFDGEVDDADMEVLLGHWGPCDNPGQRPSDLASGRERSVDSRVAPRGSGG